MTAIIKNGEIYFCRLNTRTNRIEVYPNANYGYAIAELEDKNVPERDYLFNEQTIFTNGEIIISVTSIDYVSLSPKTIDFKARVELDSLYLDNLIRRIDFVPSDFYEEDKFVWWTDILHQLIYDDLDTQNIFEKIVSLAYYTYEMRDEDCQRTRMIRLLNKIMDYLEFIR